MSAFIVWPDTSVLLLTGLSSSEELTMMSAAALGELGNCTEIDWGISLEQMR